jgi:hypothetical protein
MYKNKTISDSRLREAFEKIPTDSLPTGFIDSLMSKLEKETAKKKKMIAFLQIAAAVAVILLFMALSIYLCNFFIPDFSLSNMNVHFDSNSIAIGLAVALLLTVDSLRELKTKH